MKKTVSVSCFLLWMTTYNSAQSHIDASGGKASGSGGSASYSIGQIDYTTQSGSGGIITQGVQQPYEIFQVTTGINEPAINLNALVFPNPTSDFVELEITTDFHYILMYELFDITGKSIEQKAISSNREKIAMGSLKNGIYFLKVIGSGGMLKTFKIIKTI